MMGVVGIAILMALGGPPVAADRTPQILRIVNDFTEVTGIALPQPPHYVHLPIEEFRSAVETIGGGDLRGIDPDTLTRLEMLYDPVNNRIVRLEGGNRVENLAKNASEIPEIEELLLVHETAHAWQRQVLREGLARGQWSSVVSAAMLEGHADWMAGEYARRHGFEKAFKRISEGRQQSKHLMGQMNSYFLYHEGYEFWRYLARQHPTIDLSQVWKKLPTERQVVFPVEYVSPIPVLDLSWVSGIVEVPKDQNPKLQELGFLAFRKYAGTLAMPDSFKADAIAGYLNGVRCRDSQQQVSVLAFVNADTAQLCFQYTSMQLLRRAQGREHVSPDLAPKRMAIRAYRFDGNEPRTTCLIQDDKIVFEFDDDRPESQAVPLEDWTSSTTKRFIARRDQQSKALTGAPGRTP